jgi:hypothetical protein
MLSERTVFPGCIASAVHRISSDGVTSKPAGYISLCGGALNLPVATIIPTAGTVRSLISVSKLPHHGKAETT